MRRTSPYVVVTSTLALLACADSPTLPEDGVEAPALPGDAAVDAPGSVTVGGMVWFLSDRPPHWVYHWSGGAAQRLTVSRISEPVEVVWELVDVSGHGICAHSRVVNGRCPGGMLMHGEVPAGAGVSVEVDPVLALTPESPPLDYRLSVTLMDGREGSFEFTTYRPCTPDYPAPGEYCR
jgi:hypothetical protein